MMERCVVPPWGIFGGQAGQPSRVTLRREGERRNVKGKETLALQEGDRVTVETAGGGGYGPPARRSSDLIDRDHQEGYV
jgi:N-methylhydantoinase B